MWLVRKWRKNENTRPISDGASKPDARKPITRFLLLSDLHCGSAKALCPPNFPLADDGYWGRLRSKRGFGTAGVSSAWATATLGADPWG